MKRLCPALIGSALLGLSAAHAADAIVLTSPTRLVETTKVSAVIGVYGGGNWAYWQQLKGGPTSGHDAGWLVGGDARLNIWWLSNWSSQLDLEVESTGDFNTLDNPDGRIMGTIGKHLTWRDPDRGALGLVAGFTMTNLLNGFGTTSRSILGFEGQLYSGAVTWYGQVAWTGFQEGSFGHPEWNDNSWLARGIARWFWTPNDKLQGEIGYAQGETIGTDSGVNPYVWNWSVLHEHRFERHPFSVYFEYAGFQFDDKSHCSPCGRAIEHIAVVGLKAYVGQGTLFSNDRTGATFDMPKFVRAQAWAAWIH